MIRKRIRYFYEFPDRAINGVFRALQSVLDAGGSVLYLTAIPRRIQFEQFFAMNGAQDAVSIINCEQVDDDGNPCLKIRPKKLTVFRKPTKVSTFQCVHDLLLNLHESGKRSLVLYNDKRHIGQLMFQLEEKGIKTYRLTSDDKAFIQNEILDEYGFIRETENVYVNEAYGAVIERELLPDAHAYLCTSMIEAGTNIKGIQTVNGIYQPEDLIPMFVCKGRNEFDLDKITQFLSRVRFETEEAVIVLGSPSYQLNRSEISLRHESVRKEAEQELERHRLFGEDAEIRDMDGRRQRSLTIDGRLPDYVAIVDEVWRRYDSAVYAAEDECLMDILSAWFGIPVQVDAGPEGTKKGTEQVDEHLDEETQDALDAVLKDEQAMMSLIGTVQIDTKIPSIGRLIRFPEGFKLLKETQKLSRLSTLPREAIPKVLAARAKGKQDRAAGAVIASAEKEAMRKMADQYSERKLEEVINFQKQNTGKAVDHYVSLTAITEDAVEQGIIRYLSESERLKQLIALNKHRYFDNRLKRLFRIGGVLDMKELQMLEKEVDYVFLNQFPEGSREMRKLRVNATKAIAEYLVLRFPEKYLVDAKGRKIRMAPLKGRVSKKDIEMIAENLPASVARLAKGYRRGGTYSVQKVYEHIKAIYNIKGNEDRCPDFIEVKNLRRSMQKFIL